jgi:protein-S-isoprenylcysteine O-methyltransferase Ste14
MAKKLNLSRMRDSWMIALISLFFIYEFRFFFPDHTFSHSLFDFFALILIILCAFGRIYATAFLGGHKNKKIIDIGPYSVVRNPLYVFSWLGVLGLSLASMNILVIIFAPFSFFILYLSLIKREEAHLLESFGTDFQAYMNRVPRWIPNFKIFQCPETIEMNPKLLKNAVFDAIWWFVPFLVLELFENFGLPQNWWSIH